MSPPLVGNAAVSLTTSNQPTHTVTVPAGAANRRVVVLGGWDNAAGTSDCSPPGGAGFVQIGKSPTGSTGSRSGAWYVDVGASPPGSWTFTTHVDGAPGTAQNEGAGFITFIVTDFDPAQFLDGAVIAHNESTSNSPVTNNVSCDSDNALIVRFLSHDDGTIMVANDSGYPSGTTGIFARQTGTSSGVGVAACHAVQPTAGAAGTATWTGLIGGTGETSAHIAFAIRAIPATARASTDTAAVTLDPASESVADAGTGTLDVAALSISETRALALTSERADAAALALAESVAADIVGEASQRAGTDTISLAALTDLAGLLRIPGEVEPFDTASLALSELAALAVAIAATDTASVALTDAGLAQDTSTFQAHSRADSASVSLIEAYTLVRDDNTKTPLDNALVALAEAAALATAIAALDTASVRASGAYSLQSGDELSVNDLVSLALGELAGIFRGIDFTDTASLALSDTGARTTVGVIVKTGSDVTLLQIEERGQSIDTMRVDTVVFTFGTDEILFRL